MTTEWKRVSECELYDGDRHIVLIEGSVEEGIVRHGTIYEASHVLCDENRDPIELPEYGSAQ